MLLIGLAIEQDLHGSATTNPNASPGTADTHTVDRGTADATVGNRLLEEAQHPANRAGSPWAVDELLLFVAGTCRQEPRPIHEALRTLLAGLRTPQIHDVTPSLRQRPRPAVGLQAPEVESEHEVQRARDEHPHFQQTPCDCERLSAEMSLFSAQSATQGAGPLRRRRSNLERPFPFVGSTTPFPADHSRRRARSPVSDCRRVCDCAGSFSTCVASAKGFG